MQGNDQRPYDRGVTVFSPDGRLYQVEYAREAVRRGAGTVGVRTAEGVVFAANGRPRSPLMATDSIEKIHDIDGRLAVASAGHVADSRRLVDVARQYAQRERLRYGEPPGVDTVAKAVADFIQESTQTGGTRPFGAALLLGGVDASGPDLYEVDPSGTPTGWTATAVGSGAEASRDLLEAEYDPELDLTGGSVLAVEALAAGTDNLSAPELAVATLDSEGIDALGPDRREELLAEAGLGAS
jgi:proteasome alpha subunit